MKIGERKSSQIRGQAITWAVVLIIIFSAGLLIGNQASTDILDRLRTLPARMSNAVTPPADLPTLIVDMNFEAYNDLLDQRAGALEKGVYIPEATDFVTATIQIDTTLVPVTMRFIAGPTDHLGDDSKWGFEVRTRRNQQLLGMQRCYLIDPEANNWLDQWAFSRTLEREGILTARYQFVRLVFNGTDRGIYGLQEGFANELLTAQERPTGVIVEFDADPLWKSLANFRGDAEQAYADPVINLSADDFQYFEVDTFRDAAITRDPALSTQKDQAVGLLRALQSGTLSAAEVFDVDLYGRYLALADLWGANDAVSLVNLRYYYNPTTMHLEPIGFNANPLRTNGRIPLTATYHDPQIQAAYTREAQRVSQPAYLEALETALTAEWQRLAKVVSAEHEATPPWERLSDRQAQLQRSLTPAQPVLAYLGSPTLSMSGTLRIEVANVLNLPVEILGFDIGGATFLDPDPAWLSEESQELLMSSANQIVLRAADTTQQQVVRYIRFDVPLTEIHRRDKELDFMQEMEIRVFTRIYGLTNEQRTLAKEGYPDILIVDQEP